MTFIQFVEQVVMNVLTFALPVTAVLCIAIRVTIRQTFKAERNRRKKESVVSSEV